MRQEQEELNFPQKQVENLLSFAFFFFLFNYAEKH